MEYEKGLFPDIALWYVFVCYLSFGLNPFLFGNDLLFQILCLFTDNLRFQATGEVVILIYIFRIKTLKCVITWLISISMIFVEVNFSSLKNQNLMPSLLTSHPLCALQVSFLYFYQCSRVTVIVKHGSNLGMSVCNRMLLG